MLHLYFPNKNYSAIYLHSIFYSIGASIFGLFSGSYLYSLGVPLHFVILFFGLEFGLRGLLSPLGSVFVGKLGIPKTLLIAFFSMSIFFFVLANAPYSLKIGFFSFIFYSFGASLYYPCMHAIHAMYIQTKNRGKQLSLEIVLNSMAKIVGVSISGLVLSHTSFLFLAIMGSISLFCSFLPYAFLLEKRSVPSSNFSDPYKLLVSENFRENIIPFVGDALLIVLNSVMIPLFLFIMIGKFDNFGLFMAGIIGLETIITLIFGNIIDIHGQKKSIKFASIFYTLSIAMYLTIVHSPFVAFLVQTTQKISDNMFGNGFDSGVHQKMNNYHAPFIFSASHAMALCFSEIIILGGFSLFSYFYGKWVFSLAFICGLLGIFLITKYFRMPQGN